MTTRSFEGVTSPASRRVERRFVSPVVLLALLMISGCGEKGPVLVESGGTVTYQNKPIAGATVVFAPEGNGMPASGKTDDQGRFTLATKGQPGVVPDSYKVSISAIRLKGPISVNMTTEQILANEEVLIPKKYANLKTSGLSATVSEDPSQNDFPFKLPK